jgi:hypothetical protein
MTKALLGTLVVAMLALTGLVAFNTLSTPDVAVCPAAPAEGSASDCCTAVDTAACPLCTEGTAACPTSATAATAPCCKEGAAKPGAEAPVAAEGGEKKE